MEKASTLIPPPKAYPPTPPGPPWPPTARLLISELRFRFSNMLVRVDSTACLAIPPKPELAGAPSRLVADQRGAVLVMVAVHDGRIGLQGWVFAEEVNAAPFMNSPRRNAKGGASVEGVAASSLRTRCRSRRTWLRQVHRMHQCPSFGEATVADPRRLDCQSRHSSRWSACWPRRLHLPGQCHPRKPVLPGSPTAWLPMKLESVMLPVEKPQFTAPPPPKFPRPSRRLPRPPVAELPVKDEPARAVLTAG